MALFMGSIAWADPGRRSPERAPDHRDLGARGIQERSWPKRLVWRQHGAVSRGDRSEAAWEEARAYEKDFSSGRSSSRPSRSQHHRAPSSCSGAPWLSDQACGRRPRETASPSPSPARPLSPDQYGKLIEVHPKAVGARRRARRHDRVGTSPAPSFALTDFQSRVLLSRRRRTCSSRRAGRRQVVRLALLYLRTPSSTASGLDAVHIRTDLYPAWWTSNRRHARCSALIYGRAASYNASAICGGSQRATLQLDSWKAPPTSPSFKAVVLADAASDEGAVADPATLDLMRSCLRAPAPVFTPASCWPPIPAAPVMAGLVRRHVFRRSRMGALHRGEDRPYLRQLPSTLTDNPHLDREGYATSLQPPPPQT
jgi:hypothetical protein